eukprot:6410995-Pyramimonas_sp.AAC.1
MRRPSVCPSWIGTSPRCLVGFSCNSRLGGEVADRPELLAAEQISDHAAVVVVLRLRPELL